MYGVFELLIQRNGQKKSDKRTRKKPQENSFFLFEQSFCGVFELPLLRNAQKHHKRK
jgi:hypothetical protein